MFEIQYWHSLKPQGKQSSTSAERLQLNPSGHSSLRTERPLLASFRLTTSAMRPGRQYADSGYAGATTRGVVGVAFCMRFNVPLSLCSKNQALGAKIVKDATPENQQLLRVGMVQLDADLKTGFNSGRRGGGQQSE